jgi:alkanesulfonate monooxygenase SsuD/methylene tetrahydromethanopterin reductase-like flavin-dependent oxidoreductase (luciferase family)
MEHAIFIPPFAELAEPAAVVELALAAEERGWDGLFLWDHIWRVEPQSAEVADPWILLAAVAAVTSRLRIGPMVTPLARRRPQKVARETITLDHLSAGRLVLGVGLGVDTGGELARFAEAADPVERGAVLDEALEVLTRLWTGEPVDHHGERFTVDGVRFRPTPFQQPRIPIWVAARNHQAPRPLRRAARYDGLFPVDTSLDELAAMLDIVRTHRGSLDGFAVAYGADRDADLDALAAAGVTCAMWSFEPGHPVADILARIDAGPPT